jgi:hypothetical protein
MGAGSSLFFGFLGILCVLGIVSIIGYGLYVNYQYEAKIGAYFDNAVDCITPECILSQLQAGRDGIVNEGLTEDLYGVWIFKKPDNSMVFQYQHIDAIIERAQAVQQWKIQISSNTSSGETMKDVYNEKMDNLRLYINGEGYRSDWIANDAWWLKNHFFLAIWAIWVILLLVILAVIFFSIASVCLDNY